MPPFVKKRGIPFHLTEIIRSIYKDRHVSI